MPIRVTMEIIPHGDESRKFVAGVLDIENDMTGDHTTGNYKLKITGPVQDGAPGDVVMNDFWARGRLEGFARKRGLWSCVREALNHLKTDYDDAPNAHKMSHDSHAPSVDGVDSIELLDSLFKQPAIQRLREQLKKTSASSSRYFVLRFHRRLAEILRLPAEDYRELLQSASQPKHQ